MLIGLPLLFHFSPSAVGCEWCAIERSYRWTSVSTNSTPRLLGKNSTNRSSPILVLLRRSIYSLYLLSYRLSYNPPNSLNFIAQCLHKRFLQVLNHSNALFVAATPYYVLTFIFLLLSQASISVLCKGSRVSKDTKWCFVWFRELASGRLVYM